MHAHRRHHPASGPRAQRGAASPWIFAGFLAVAGFFFFTEHRAHLLGVLPYVLLALCPLMHLFHGRHGHGAGASHRHGAPGGNAPADPPAGPHPPHAH